MSDEVFFNGSRGDDDDTERNREILASWFRFEKHNHGKLVSAMRISRKRTNSAMVLYWDVHEIPLRVEAVIPFLSEHFPTWDYLPLVIELEGEH